MSVDTFASLRQISDKTSRGCPLFFYFFIGSDLTMWTMAAPNWWT